jgi:hypothetical protein
MSDKAKEGIKRADKTIFVCKSPVTMTILVLPPFVNDAKCKCGKDAEFMLDDMNFICSDCVGKEFVHSNHMMKEEDISIPLTRITINKIKFEWSVNQSRWYTIWGRNIKPKSWDKFVAKIREIILSGKITMFEGEYDKEKKEMVIY